MQRTERTGSNSNIPRRTINDLSDIDDRIEDLSCNMDLIADFNWILVCTPLLRFAFSVFNYYTLLLLNTKIM